MKNDLRHEPGREVSEEGCRFIAACVREEGKTSENRQEKREVEDAGKVEVAPRVTVGSMRRF